MDAETAGRTCRICFVIARRSYGGAERASGELAGALAQLGCDVHLVIRAGADADYPIDERVTIHEVDPGWDARRTDAGVRAFAAALRAARQVLRIKPDVLVPFLPWAECAAWCAAWASDAVLVATVRNDPATHPKSKLLRFCKDRFCKRADLIYLQNRAQAGYFPASWRDKLLILPNLVDPAFFGVATHDGPVYRFVAVGRLEAQKNHAMMIRAFAGAAALLPGAKLQLDIYGEGRLRVALENLIRQLGMEKRIALHGFVPDIAARYAAADAFLLSSNFEGQPNALMEAMAAGLACISTACPTGPSELIREGVDGVLVPCGDAAAMAQAIVALVADPAAARQMGRSARQRIVAVCSRDAVGARFLAACRRAAKARQKKRPK